jgi:hypothetical protein
MLENVLDALHTKMGLDLRSEYLNAIGKVFIDGIIGTDEEKEAHARRTKVMKRYEMISMAQGTKVTPEPEELPQPRKVVVHFNTDAQDGILPENITQVEISSPNHGKEVPIRTATLKAQPGDYLDLRIWVTFMIGREEFVTDKHFKLPDKFFNNLTAKKLENYEKKSLGTEPYVFPSRKSGCDHFINVYPVKKSRNGNEYRLLELGWRSTARSGWKWDVTIAGGATEPTVRPWLMTSKAIRTWRIRRRNLTVHNAVDQSDSDALVHYQRTMNDIDVTPLIVTSMMDYVMERNGSERRNADISLFNNGVPCVPAHCELCVHKRMPNDWETAGNDRVDGGLWSQAHPLIQRTACVIQNRFLDWHECQELNDGTQESDTVVSRRGSQVWLGGRWKTFSTNGEETYMSGLDYSTYWDEDEDENSMCLEELDDRPYAVHDPNAPWNDTIEEGVELDYDEENWRGENRLSIHFGTAMSFHKRGNEFDSIHSGDEWKSKKFEDEIPLTLGELTEDDPGIAKLDVSVGLRTDFQDAYAWIGDQVRNNVSYCNHFHGKHPDQIGYTAVDGYAALNNYDFGKLLKCTMKNVPRRKQKKRKPVVEDGPDMFCPFPEDYEC